MKPEEAIEDIRKCIQPSVGGKSLQMAIEALEKQVAKNSKEMTWKHFIKSMQMNSYEIEYEMLDPEDNSVAGDEIISVVPQSFVLGLMYSIAEGKTIILPPE